jgi:hypothetical protein
MQRTRRAVERKVNTVYILALTGQRRGGVGAYETLGAQSKVRGRYERGGELHFKFFST